MRQCIVCILLWLVFFAGSGCRKFLNEPAGGGETPRQVSDLKKLLNYEGYPLNDKSFHSWLNILDDDVGCDPGNAATTLLQAGKPAYTWSRGLNKGMKPLEGDENTYSRYYNRIKGCNAVLDQVAKVSGNQAEKDQLEGEARVLRAYYYFMLVNLYARPYNANGYTPDKSPGVPLLLSSTITGAALPRNSVQEVYRQVEQDLEQGCALLEKAPEQASLYSISKYAAWLLASRVFLYSGNWDKSIAYAGKLLQVKPTVMSFRKKVRTGIGILVDDDPPVSWAIDPSNTEILFLFGSPDDARLIDAGSDSWTTGFVASDGLAALFGKDDLRLYYYLRPADQSYVCAKFRTETRFGKCFRISEAYLNRAEASIRKAMQQGDNSLLQQALSDLNTLRSNRFEADKFVAATLAGFGDTQKLLTFCLNERRRELCFEEQRWFDLRRQGMPPLKHVYYAGRSSRPEVVTLSAADSRYVLQLPEEALEANSALQQNP